MREVSEVKSQYWYEKTLKLPILELGLCFPVKDPQIYGLQETPIDCATDFVSRSEPNCGC